MSKSQKKQCRNFSVTEFETKGRGLVSNRIIKSGELILKENADLIIKIDDININFIDEKYQNFSMQQKQLFDKLRSKNGTKNSKCDVFLNNAINIDEDNYGVFWNISMVNHSCSPNAAWGSTENCQVLELRALTNIESNTEICVDYIGDKSFLMNTQERKSLLDETWGFSCSCDRCTNGEQEALLSFFGKIRIRMREKMCAGDYQLVYKLHCQKMMSLSKMTHINHQELLTCHQVKVILCVLSEQSRDVIKKALQDWDNCCDSDRLYESRRSYNDIGQSFIDGEIRHRLEFFDENNCVRKEWIQWVYNKL